MNLIKHFLLPKSDNGVPLQWRKALVFLTAILMLPALMMFVLMIPNVHAQTVPPLSKRGGIDIDGNNKSVLLIRSSVQMQAGRLVNNQFQFTAQSDPGASFRLVAATDFDGNGKSDLTFQNPTQLDALGKSSVQAWNDFVPANLRAVRDVKPVWDVQAVGDLDGDGLGDLVWRYVVADSPDTGVSYIWFSSGATGSGAPVVRKRGGAPLTWKLLGAADLNGDGAADMLYVSPDGSIRALMATAGRTCANLSAGTLPAGFSALRFADFTGRGRGDVLLRNAAGQVSILTLNAIGIPLPPFTGNPDDPNASCTPTSLTVTNAVLPVLASDPSWQLYATGDYNGDGIFDIVWLRPDGTLTLWLMNANGAAPTVYDNAGTPPAGFVVFHGTTAAPEATTSAMTPAIASRFLAQATFGASMSEINALTAANFDAWLNTQFAKPQTLHLPNTVAYLNTLPPDQQRGQTSFNWSLWKNFAVGDDTLRQRVAYSLSQIFVISLDSNLSFGYPRGPANYLDTLGAKAFGNYRDLLEAVTYSPMMGQYLSSLKNQKENPLTGSVPDENYAREVMQLFSIGLYQLNNDGTYKLNASGQPIETYSNADITGLAKVFTGLSFGGPDTSDNRFIDKAQGRDLDREIKPMQAYNQFHSTSEKKFLGVTIPASAVADTNGDIKIALDTLFNHPNVGPFIGEQLIQRLVTSNPSTAYVARVSAAFNNNGSGVRGDMKAVIKAVLVDPEARNLSAITTQSGKLREPVVRLMNWMRAFNAKSADGRFLLGDSSDPSTSLAQSPMRAPSVFNFYRPSYSPPNSNVGAANLVAPEAQITNETSIAGYLNFMRGVVSGGVGTTANGARDVQADYSAELALANDPDALLDRVNLLLVAGNLSTTTRAQIRAAIVSVNIGTTNPDSDRRNRVNLAVYLTMASPDYILQN